MPKSPAARTSRRPKLTEERVIASAMRIADKEGLDALSMRRLAQSLRVEAMSLYNHFANKEAILDALVEQVFRLIFVPEVGTAWQTAMHARAVSARKALLLHPWAAALSESRSTSGPIRLRLCNAVLAVLLEAEFSMELAQSAFVTLDSYIYGFALQQANWPFLPEQRQQALESFIEHTNLEAYPHVSAIAEHAKSSPEVGTSIYDRQFEFGLALILEGLERARRKEPHLLPHVRDETGDERANPRVFARPKRGRV